MDKMKKLKFSSWLSLRKWLPLLSMNGVIHKN